MQIVCLAVPNRAECMRVAILDRALYIEIKLLGIIVKQPRIGRHVESGIADNFTIFCVHCDVLPKGQCPIDGEGSINADGQSGRIAQRIATGISFSPRRQVHRIGFNSQACTRRKCDVSAEKNFK